MQITKFLKWLPVLLSVLGALGYSSRDTELVRAGIVVLSRLGEGGFDVGDLTGLLNRQEDDARSSSKSRAEPSAKNTRQTYKGRVTKVSDGDTMHVTDSSGRKHKIRMAYIDAPETNQAYGTRSRDNLRAAADGKTVRVRVFETDRYQREVAQVTVGNTDLNLMQIRDGAAWHYESYAKKQQNKIAFSEYAEAQKQAQKNRAGLWQHKNPQAPWDFRREERNAGGKQTDSSGQWFGIW